MLFAARSQGSFVSFVWDEVSYETGTHFNAVTTIINDPIDMFGPADNSGVYMKGAPFLSAGTYNFKVIQAYSGTSGAGTVTDSCIAMYQVGSGGGGEGPTNADGDCVLDPFVEGETGTYDLISVGTYGMWLGSRMETLGFAKNTGTAIIEIHKMY